MGFAVPGLGYRPGAHEGERERDTAPFLLEHAGKERRVEKSSDLTLGRDGGVPLEARPVPLSPERVVAHGGDDLVRDLTQRPQWASAPLVIVEHRGQGTLSFVK